MGKTLGTQICFPANFHSAKTKEGRREREKVLKKKRVREWPVPFAPKNIITVVCQQDCLILQSQMVGLDPLQRSILQLDNKLLKRPRIDNSLSVALLRQQPLSAVVTLQTGSCAHSVSESRTVDDVVLRCGTPAAGLSFMKYYKRLSITKC